MSDDDDFYPRTAPSRGLGPGGRSLDFERGGIDRPDPSGLVKRKDRGYGDRIAEYNEMDRSKDFGPGLEGRDRGFRRGGGHGQGGGDDGLPVPPLYSIQRGRVVKIEDFGAFIEMDGYGRKHGLIHRSQLSKYKVDKPSDVLDLNDSVFIKVISLEKDDSGRSKIGLSMKYADQSRGTDLDPNNSAWLAEQAKRASGVKGSWEPDPLRAEDALRNATCRRCGGKGHIASECFSQVNKQASIVEEEQAGANGDQMVAVPSQPSKPAYKQYDLIPSDDEAELEALQTQIAAKARQKEEKKRKKELLEKLERGEKVEPGDMDQALLLLKKKKRKEKKEKKAERKREKKDRKDRKKDSSKKRKGSSDNSDSSSSSPASSSESSASERNRRHRHGRDEDEHRSRHHADRKHHSRSRSRSPRRRDSDRQRPSPKRTDTVERYRRPPSPMPESRYRESRRSYSRDRRERGNSRDRERGGDRERSRDRDRGRR